MVLTLSSSDSRALNRNKVAVARHSLKVARNNSLPGPHVVYIPASRRNLTLGHYLKLWQSVKAAPVGTVYRASLTGECSSTREHILDEFARGLDDRINSRVPGYGVGRRWESDNFFATWRLARAVNSRAAIRAADIPSELRARFLDMSMRGAISMRDDLDSYR